MADFKLTDSQQRGLNLLKAGQNCFIYGPAGTGKTTLIETFVNEYCVGKKVLKCAYTALAADHMEDGRTTHSAFWIEDYPTVKDREWSSRMDLSANDIIIIDEISMIRIDYFEGFIKTINRASKKRELFGFKPIQIVLCGDFFQLPPIATEAEVKVLGELYGKDIHGVPKIYAFESEYWDKSNIISVHLAEVVRQKDQKFLDILNNIKLTTNIIPTLQELKELSAKQSNPKAVNLYASNSKVNADNKAHLDALPGKEWKFTCSFNEDFKKALKEGFLKEDDIPVEQTLYLKENARVMFTKNDPINSSNRKYQNGSLGTIRKITNDSITVELDDDHELVTIPVETNLPSEEKKFSWSVWDEPYCKNGKVIQNPHPKIAYQIPLKLAYAITIHKSQGQTYEYVNFDPKEDECTMQEGQLYVLVSRLKEVSGLYLINDIQPDQCKTSLKVIEFYKNQKGA